MKILILSTNADEAGAPRHVEIVVNGLICNHDFILVFGDSGPVYERSLRRGYKSYVVKEMRTSINPVKDLIALYKILKIIRMHDPDVIHCHSAKAGMLGRFCAFFQNKKWVYTVHGWGWRGLSGFARWLIVGIERLLAFVPNGKYIFVAKAVVDDAIQVLKIHRNKGSLIYNGVPMIQIHESRKDNFLTILMPARVSSAKDHAALLRAFEKFEDKESRLLLCGEGTNSRNFIAEAQLLAPNSFSRISFLGQQSNMENIYSQCDIVALISKFEALPLSIIEGMSCGKAILATDVGGVAELIVDGQNGLLVSSNDVDRIIFGLNRLRDKAYRMKLGFAARSKYFETYTEKSMLEKIEKIYTEANKN